MWLSQSMALFVQSPKLEAEVFCRCIANDMVKEPLSSMGFTKSEKHWILRKDDGRKKNKGSWERIARSLTFKKMIILELEKTLEMHPEQADQAATYVSMCFNLTQSLGGTSINHATQAAPHCLACFKRGP